MARTSKFRNMTTTQQIAAAQEVINSDGLTHAKVVALNEVGSSLKDSRFTFEDVNHGGVKTIKLSSFLVNSNIKPTEALATSKSLGVNVVQTKPPTRNYSLSGYQAKFYTVHNKSEFELLDVDWRGVLVQHHVHGGYFKRYKNFAQALGLDPMFNTVNRGPFYIAQGLIDRGYFVELEYTIPGSQRRIDIAVYRDKDLTNLVGFIEFDGAQHHRSVEFFGDDAKGESLSKRHGDDVQKNTYAYALQKPLIRVSAEKPGSPQSLKSGIRDAIEQIVYTLEHPSLP